MLRLVADNSAPPAGADRHRRALLGKVHIAAKTLAMHDEDYRTLLRRVAGVDSAKDCTVRQLGDVVAEFERLGFKASRSPASRQRATHPVAAKARALWISLHQLGAIDDPSEAALEAFGRRQLGVDRLQWAD